MAHKTSLNDLRHPCSVVKTTMLVQQHTNPEHYTRLSLNKTIFYSRNQVNSSLRAKIPNPPSQLLGEKEWVI